MNADIVRNSLTSSASTGADGLGADGLKTNGLGANALGANGLGANALGTDRHSRGSARFHDTLGPAGTEILKSLADVAPDMAGFIVDFAYGEVHARPGLSARQRSLVTIGVLSGIGGCEPQLTAHVHGALNVGLPPAEIVEAMLHCTVYAGFPRALNALTVLRAVFVERGLLPGSDPNG